MRSLREALNDFSLITDRLDEIDLPITKNVNMSKFRTPFNYAEFPRPMKEQNNGVGKTVPDMTMSVRELLVRVQRGLPIHMGRTPVYNGDMELPDVDRLDLAEIEELRRTLNKRVSDLEAQYKEEVHTARVNKANKVLADRKEQEKRTRELIERQVLNLKFRNSQSSGTDDAPPIS